jgi:LuxR family transcriptional regulator, maltose regulon positive regulatory protein
MMAVNVANSGPCRTRRSAGPAGDPILTSKITVPEVPEWAVLRPRITGLIAEGTRWCPLTVVTGPPGAGKTMAVALWAAAQPGSVAWVGLDDFDNRPGMFWSYVVAALRRSGVAVPRAMQLVPQPRAVDEGFLLRLTAALANQDPAVTLVLDDVHMLREPEALKELDFVLRNAGAGLRIVVTSRMDPLLPLHRYRVAGQLAEIRASDLAFSVAEASLLLAERCGALPADALDALIQRTEGWAAGLRLAAMSLDGHPDPGQFVKELMAEDSALISYLVDEVLNVAPPPVREVLLCTSILEHVKADAAVDLTGDARAGGILAELMRTNAFVQPIGSGWYRYHTLFAEMLRLKLRLEHPDRVPVLHQRAARWYERKGMLTDAVRQAVRAGDWPLAAGMVVDDLAIGQLIGLRGGQDLVAEFARMPSGPAWTSPAPYLVSAAIAVAAGQHDSCAAALNAAEPLLAGLPAAQQVAGRLAAEVIRLTSCLRTGDLTAAAPAADRAELMLRQAAVGKLAAHPEVTQHVLSGRAAVELWSGRPEEAVRILEAGLAAEAAAGRQYELADWAGPLALAEALAGRLSRAAELAGQALPGGIRRPPGQHPHPAPLVALAWVHLERNELHQARGALMQADASLGASPDRLTGAVAYLVAAGGALAEGRATMAAQIAARARSGWSAPAWLDQQLTLAESRAWAAAGDVQAAVAAAERAGPSSEAAAALAYAWAVAGDGENASRALTPALADGTLPDRVRLQALLVDARLGYACGDAARGRRALASALRLAEREQLTLPLLTERSWLGPVLQRDPELTDSHRRLLEPALGTGQLPAPAPARDQEPILIIEPLTEREREVLVHVSGMLNTAEVASEMYISVNTVKTHLRNIYRKLAAAHRNEAVRRARQLELI